MMKLNHLLGIFAAGVAAFTFASCHTRAGRGAAIGAGAGAVVAGPPGAAVGAASGAIIGASVDESRTVDYAPAPSSGYPLAKPARKAGFYYSPYTGRAYDLRAVPSGGLVPDQDTKQLFRKP